MSRWWRAYDEALHDPKLVDLSDRLHRAWFQLLCVASKHGGVLPPVKTIAIELRVTAVRAAEYVTALVKAGLLDETETGFTPHNWNTRQFQSDVSTDRVKRFRKRHESVSSTVSETPPETDTENREDSEVSTSANEPVGEEPKAKLFRVGKTLLVSFGIAEKRTGALLGQWLKTRDDPEGLLAAIQFARERNVAEPVAYISAVLKQEKSNGTGPKSIRERAQELADEWRQREFEASFHRPAYDAGSH